MRSVYRRFFGVPTSDELRTQITGPNAASQGATILYKLPPEIRLKIWREVVGDSLLHLTLVHSSPRRCLLRSFSCRAFDKTTNTEGKDTPPRCQGSQKKPCFFSGPTENPFSAVSFLLTSRQIYTEAVDLLYSTNAINVDALEPLQIFITWIGQRVQSIQTVHVNIALWRIRHRDISKVSEVAFAEWKQFWELLVGNFTDLQHVRLDIYGTSHAGLQHADLQPLLGLRGLKSFNLAVWRDTDEEGSAGQDLALSQSLEAYVRGHVYGALPPKNDSEV
ncbi:MAG: hypothetical protein Q9170_001630 [Blastenia crenularia]